MKNAGNFVGIISAAKRIVHWITKSYVLIYVCIFCGLCGEVSVSVAIASPIDDGSAEQICSRWFEKQQFTQAADCFLQLFNKADPNVKEADRYKLGTWLRNAALALQKAAEQESRVERAALFREQCVKILDDYLQKKYYATDTQKRIIETTRRKLQDAIGYAHLTITTGDLKASIAIVGYQFRAHGSGTWSRDLRPGSYNILVSYSGFPAQAQNITLSSGQPQVVRFQPPQNADIAKPPPKPPLPSRSNTLSWVFIVGGTAVAVLGGGLLGWSMITISQRDTIDAKIEQTSADTRNIKQLQSASTAQYTSGWIAIGLGSASLVTGITMLAITPSKTLAN